MKKLFGGFAMATVVMLAIPAWAQGVTTKGESTRENAPGTAGTSKAGVPGLPDGNTSRKNGAGGDPGRSERRPERRARPARQ
jgi:hypothetical protein